MGRLVGDHSQTTTDKHPQVTAKVYGMGSLNAQHWQLCSSVYTHWPLLGTEYWQGVPNKEAGEWGLQSSFYYYREGFLQYVSNVYDELLSGRVQI